MSDVRTSVKDAAYTAVGVGVLGAQQAAALGQQTRDKVVKGAGDVHATARSKAGEARSSANHRAGDLRDQLDTLVQELGERVESLITDVRDRVEPVIDKVVAKAEEIAEIGTAKARTLLGHEAKAPAAKSRAA